MGQLRIPVHGRSSPAPVWRRLRRRRWSRPLPLLGPEAMLAFIPSLPRAELARITERLIDRLDTLDGDPDLELHGDELDGSNGEDDFQDHDASWLRLPGCPISDPGEDEHDREQEPSHY
jgi:hypothetical protein